MKQNTLTKWVLAVGAAALVTVGSATAGTTIVSSKNVVTPVEPAESWWNAQLSAGWDSRYLKHGVDVLANGNNDGLFWTDLSFSAGGFTVGAWFAEAVKDDYNELNAYLSYGYSFGQVDLEAGYIYYYLPKSGNADTHEFFARVSTSAVPFVTPSLTAFYDVDARDGVLLQFALNSSIPVVENLVSIDPFASISYSFDYNSDRDDLNNVELGVAVPVHLSENITLKGYVKHSWALDAIDDFQEDEWVAGASITFAF